MNCKYAQHQKGQPGAPSYPILICETGHAEDEEYPAYGAAKRGEADALVPAIRHWLNGVVRDPVSLFTAILALSTIFLWLSTRRLWRGAEAQARDFKRSVEEAARSAAAMEGVAASMAINAEQVVKSVGISRGIAKTQKSISEMQLRAYLSVVFQTATYQDREKNLKFAMSPLLINNGHTPAHKVRYAATAAILPNPLPIDAQLAPPVDNILREGMIPPNQNRGLFAMLDEFIPDDEVMSVMLTDKRALYMWWVVTYEDAFKQKRRTEFCQMVEFYQDPQGTWMVKGFYTPGRNTAD